MLILFKMKTRWHHLVTYAASRCLPPPQPQLMSTPLSHCLVDCRLSPSSWPTTDHNHHRCRQHPPSPRLLLHPFIVMRYSSFFTLFLSRPRTCWRRHRRHQRRRHRLRLPPTSTVFCLIVVYYGRCRCLLLPCLSFDSSSSSTEPPQPRPSTSHSRLPLPPRSHLFLPP